MRPLISRSLGKRFLQCIAGGWMRLSLWSLPTLFCSGTNSMIPCCKVWNWIPWNVTRIRHLRHCSRLRMGSDSLFFHPLGSNTFQIYFQYLCNEVNHKTNIFPLFQPHCFAKELRVTYMRRSHILRRVWQLRKCELDRITQIESGQKCNSKELFANG